MKRWLRRLSMGLGLVVGLAVVALAVFTAISVTRQRKIYAIWAVGSYSIIHC